LNLPNTWFIETSFSLRAAATDGLGCALAHFKDPDGNVLRLLA
jgi:hypothetical protein